MFKVVYVQSKQISSHIYSKWDHSELYINGRQEHFRAGNLPWEPHTAGRCIVAGQYLLVGQCCCLLLLSQSSAQSGQRPFDIFLGSHGFAGIQSYPGLQKKYKNFHQILNWKIQLLCFSLSLNLETELTDSLNSLILMQIVKKTSSVLFKML